MQDLTSFTKNVANGQIIDYMRSYFDENLAIYSIMNKYRGYEVSSDYDESGVHVYRLTALHGDENALNSFINNINGRVIYVYGSTFGINIMRSGNVLLLRFTKI